MILRNASSTSTLASKVSRGAHSRRKRFLAFMLAALPLAVGIFLWNLSSWRPVIRQVSSVPVKALRWSASAVQLRVSTSASGWGQAQNLTVDSSTLEVVEKRDLHVTVGVFPWAETTDEKTTAVSEGNADNDHSLSVHSYIKLFSTQSGKLISQKSSCEVLPLVFSPDGTRLLAGAESCGTSPIGESGNWSLWEIHEQRFGRLLSTNEEPCQAVAWTQDGHLAWFALRGGEVGNVTRDGKINHRFNLFHSIARDERNVTAFALAPDDKTLALATVETTPKSSANTFSLVDTRTGRILRSWNSTTLTTVIAFSLQEDSLAIADSNTVTLHSMNKEVTRSLPVVGATTLAFSPDGSRLAIGTSHGDIQLWRIK